MEIGHPVTRAARERRNGHRGAIVWLTGLSGAGKSTMATALERALFDRGVQVVVLDGDRIRTGLSSDLTFSAADRRENIRRVAEVARLFADAGLVVITAFISPYVTDRERARQIAASTDLPFVEVHVDAPLAVCEARDPKGLYARARSGQVPHFTGVTDPYEPPVHADLVLHTDREDVDACVARLLAHVGPMIAMEVQGSEVPGF
jgi:adenylyl-sulfate kinase